MNGKTAASPLSRRKATALLREIREGLLNVERNLVEFVKGNGWVALGYVSFEECWKEHLSDVRLATDAMRAVVVFALFAEHKNDDGIVEALRGRVGDRTVAHLRRQYAHGVPPELASTQVRGHWRGLPHEPTDFRIRLEAEERAQWKAAIEAHGHDWHEWMVRVLRREVGKLERSGVRR